MNEDLKALAGEYVLGLLGRDERAAAEALAERDAEFREAVDAFAAKMHALDLTAAPASAPRAMWERIEEAIRNMPQEARGTATIVPWRSRTSPPQAFRRMALAASLVVGAGLGYFVGELTRSPQQPVVLVVLNNQENAPGAIFEAFADNSVRIVPLQDFEVPEGMTLQVWTLYDRAVGPVSLGTIARADTTVLQGRLLPVPTENQLYEITLEPAPGSPTGKPTGPILVKGLAKRPVGTVSG